MSPIISLIIRFSYLTSFELINISGIIRVVDHKSHIRGSDDILYGSIVLFIISYLVGLLYA